MSIRTQIITGNGNVLSGTGSVRTAAGMTEVTVDGVKVSFEKRDSPSREIIVSGSFGTMGMKLNTSHQASVNGTKLRVEGNALWINQTRVTFSGDRAVVGSAVSNASGQQQLAALRARYPDPRITFTGDALVHIAEDVVIEPGATIELTPGLRIERSLIGASAKIHGGRIADSEVRGSVHDQATVERSVLEEGSRVFESGTVIDSRLQFRARVYDNATVRHSVLEARAQVSDNATVVDSHLCGDVAVGGNATVKNSGVGKGSKISDNAVVIDSRLGDDVEIKGNQQVNGATVASGETLGTSPLGDRSAMVQMADGAGSISSRVSARALVGNVTGAVVTVIGANTGTLDF